MEGDNRFFHQPTDFAPYYLSFHPMYARHPRLFEVQGRFSFSLPAASLIYPTGSVMKLVSSDSQTQGSNR